ncbi:MFS general substrate transporter [Basidiobolus meristosporus CBS 931.73]|uniref:MFS general substrate transporter n=1 Tax=Basidiobolus meristosporus CBS 931.73 TaxID=1314790 RepID=A0A1Y1YTN8_9FUNG|nr:MFS general substrate transporter [Basidiobolus meristosporus CBS 931.73]|eukprot:ORY01402.1 MFS general substrate transporter [Basidiobolus meristosporus CBS 931.73]
MSSNNISSRAADTPTPLPKRQLFIICVARAGEPISMTILFPFIYYVRDFNFVKDESEVGYYAGYIASSFAVAQVLTGIPWGILSDRIGRRPVILMGFFGTFMGTFLFGFSKSLTWAIVTRSMCGLLNGNVGVIKSMVAEITDLTNQSVAFSLLPLVWGVGSIVGPILGGLLSQPAEQYPSLFGQYEFFHTYPYFLPCFVSSMISLMGLILAFFYLEESLDAKARNPGLSERTPLLTETGASQDSEASASNGLLSAFTRNTVPVIIGYMLLALQSIITDEIIPIWAATTIVKGGLHFTTKQTGLFLSFCGLITPPLQWFLYPKFHKIFGPRRLYQLSMLLLAPVYFTIPFVSNLARDESDNGSRLVWAALLSLIGLRAACNVFSFTNCNILVANSAPSRRVLGSLNGINQVACSIMRAIGPTLGGTLWSWSLSHDYSFPFDFHFIFNFLSLIALATALETLLMKDSYVDDADEVVSQESSD